MFYQSIFICLLNQENFLKDNFETLSREAFLQKLDSLQAADGSASSRLSLSSRFLSRTQQQYLHNISNQQSVVARLNSVLSSAAVSVLLVGAVEFGIDEKMFCEVNSLLSVPDVL